MRTIRLKIHSDVRDQVGHLVRAIQMLGSYGDEWQLEGTSDVVTVEGERTGLAVIVTGRSNTTPQLFDEILREVHWSLAPESGPEIIELTVLGENESLPPGTRLLTAEEFSKLYEWGHQDGMVPPDGSHAQPSLGQ